jgi:hypothetical protein
MYGGKIRIVTTQNTYLSISGFEAWTGAGGSSTTTTTTTGGRGSYNIPANTKVGFNMGSVKQSTNYGNNAYPASNAWSNGSKFTHTNAGVDQWWEVRFNRGYWIDRVRVRNRSDCCGGRLAGTKVMVDNQLCGQVPGGTKNGQWYTVKCSEPMYGGKIRLVTTQNTYLSISGFEAWTGAGGSSTTTTTNVMRPNGPSTKITL